jgi:uncharacterized protein
MQHHLIDYVEFPARELQSCEAFFTKVFGWKFEAYGPDYLAFSGSGIAGGFFRAALKSETVHGAALVVIYSESLATTQAAVIAAGGTIVKPIFSFPGGRRFQFLDPVGNEWAVWSDR